MRNLIKPPKEYMLQFLEGKWIAHYHHIPYQYMNWVLYYSGSNRLVKSGMPISYGEIFIAKDVFENYLRSNNEC